MKYGAFIKSLVVAILLLYSGCGSGTSGEGHKKYLAIVDAGSSGSRIYLYTYKDQNINSIQTVCSHDIKPGLSSYAQTPSDVGSYISSLVGMLDGCIDEQNINTQDQKIDFYLLATAGMRSVEESKQDAIYSEVNRSVSTIAYINPVEIKTISGEQEGLYDWLAVNFLADVFINCDNKTFGAVDVGGASTQIAYEVDSLNDATFSRYIEGCRFDIFSISFLGLGQDRARNSMDGFAGGHNNICYPKGYNDSGYNGNFNYAECFSAYSDVTKSYDVVKQLKQIEGEAVFIGFSSVYYTADFLKITDNPVTDSAYGGAVQDICNKNYDELRKSYSSIPDKYLSAYCANSVYLQNLLFSPLNYNLNAYTIYALDRMGGKEITWSVGATVDIISQNRR